MNIRPLIRTYLSEFSPRATRLLAIGLIPLFSALAYLLLSRLDPNARYGVLWQARAFAFWVDSLGISFLLLLGGAAILDYAEKHDPPAK